MKGITFLQGILVGMIIAFPKGPAGFMVINQTVLFGTKSGLETAFGPMMTTFVSSFIILYFSKFDSFIELIKKVSDYKIVHVISGFILMGIGIYIFRMSDGANSNGSIVISFKLFLLTFLEPLLFPMTIVTFLWIAPKITSQEFSLKVFFFLGIIFGTVLFYGCSCSFFNWLSVTKRIENLIIVRMVVGMTFILFGQYVLESTYYKTRSTT
ncbi:MAG TPA: hypothetical protein PKZ56_00575 [Candidatus Paceibacterota bacterium]|jgi:threonine/homoserine/homoserine lactone efflux protein|nr:hypothetical protein [Candidatus Paceibacterota bacterium]